MDFNAVQISFLQSLLRERPDSRRASQVAKFFCEQYSIGRAFRSQIEYQEAHFAAVQKLLESNDLPVEPLARNSKRADVAGFGGLSEKVFSTAPHANSVAVKVVGNCTLDGHTLYTPNGAYLVLTTEKALRVSCQRLMLVENLETFRELEAYEWIDFKNLDVLAIYRGDKELSIADAGKVIRERTEAIWSFCDFDPAGLVIANSFPCERLEALILPPLAWLTAYCKTPRGRQLFDQQFNACARALDKTSHPQITQAWALMQPLQGAVTQEGMKRYSLD
jgi:hypothetical protein